MTSQAAGIGHNQPPSDAEIIHEKLAVDYDDLLQMVERGLAKEAEVPKEILNDDDDGKASDYLKKLSQLNKMMDAARKGEKEKWDEKAKAVHSFFKKRMETIDDVIKRVKEPHEAYKLAKADKARRAAEEKARIAQEEANERLRVAQEAQRVADEARIKAEADAKAAKDKADADAKAAKERADEAKRKADADAAEIRRKAQEEADKIKADADRIRKEAQDRDDESKRDAAKREKEARDKEAEAEKIKKQAEKDAAEVTKEADRVAREEEKAGRESVRNAEEVAKAANREVKDLQRASNAALDVAARADKVAEKAERKADVGLAELSRTRGDHSVSSVSVYWTGEIVDRRALDLDALRDHIPFDALDQAVKAFARATEGKVAVEGARFFEDVRSRVM